MGVTEGVLMGPCPNTEKIFSNVYTLYSLLLGKQQATKYKLKKAAHATLSQAYTPSAHFASRHPFHSLIILYKICKTRSVITQPESETPACARSARMKGAIEEVSLNRYNLRRPLKVRRIGSSQI